MRKTRNEYARWTGAWQTVGMQKEAVTINHCISVIAIVGEKEKHVIVCDIALAQGGDEITLDRAH